MRSTASTRLGLTIEEYADLPDDGWWTELVRGEVIREPQPSYEHGRVQVNVAAMLKRYIEEHDLPLVCVGSFGVIMEERPGTVRGPDAAVVRKDRIADLHRAGFLRGAPDLAVEVVSPSNLAGAMQAKVAEYLGAGARTVWVVYPETRTVVVHDSPDHARFVGPGDDLTGGDLMPDLRVPVSEIFGE